MRRKSSRSKDKCRVSILLLIMFVWLGVLSACGSGGGMSGSATQAAPSVSNSTSSSSTPSEAESFGWSEETDFLADAAESGERPAPDRSQDPNSSVNFSAVRANARLILRADLSIETQSFEETRQEVESLTATAGGYIESSGLYGAVGNRTADYVIRVPQQQFDSFLRNVGDSCHIVSQNTSQEDIADQYTDQETRLATLRTKHERLLTLLEQAATMEDIIALENALSETEYEIDSITGELRSYDSLVDFSTISLYIREVQSLSAVAEQNAFSAQVTQAAITGLNGLEMLLRSLILTALTIWPFLLIVLFCVVLGVHGYRKRKAKRKEQEQKTLTGTEDASGKDKP